MRSIRTIRSFMKAAIESNAAYRGAIVIWMLSSIVRIVVSLSLWLSASNALAGGYTKSGIINYYVMSMFLEWVLLWNPFYPISQEIKSGQVVTYLIRPVSFFYAWLGRETGFKIVATIMLSLIGIPLLTILNHVGLPLHFYPNASWFFLFIAIPGAILTSFLITMCMSLLAFWLTEVQYVNYVYWTLMPLFGGLFLPVSFLPNALERLNKLFLFRYQLSFPLEILFNRLGVQEIIVSSGIMCIWIFSLTFLYRFLWKKGIRVYSAFGQ